MKQKIYALLVLLILVLLVLPIHSQEDELLVENNEEILISGTSLVLTGDIMVKNNSQLTILGSKIQLSVRGETPYNISISDQGRLVIIDSQIETLSGNSIISFFDRSNITLINSNITGFKTLTSSPNSSLRIRGGRLNIGNIECLGETFSIDGGSIIADELRINTTRAYLKNFKGSTVTMKIDSSTLQNIECNYFKVNSSKPLYLNHSVIETCILQSDEEVIVTNSTFKSMKYISSGRAINVRTTGKGPRAGGPINAAPNVTVQRYWDLNVKVTDLTGTGIPANILLTDYLENTILFGVADFNGTYSKPILAEVINGSKTKFYGNYRVRAEYKNFTTQPVPLVLDRIRDISLKFIDYVPLETTTQLTLSPGLVRVGDTVKISGSINPPVPDEIIEIIAVSPGNSKLESVSRTDLTGFFEYEFEPSVEGRWIIYADWLGGGAQGIATRSRAVPLIVEARPSLTTLFIRALPMVIMVLGVISALAFLALNRLKKFKV